MEKKIFCIYKNFFLVDFLAIFGLKYAQNRAYLRAVFGVYAENAERSDQKMYTSEYFGF